MKIRLGLLALIAISFCTDLIASIHLTDQNIIEIYRSYVEIHGNKEYQLRYVPLPLHKNKGPWFWEGRDFPRVIALLEFERFIKENNIICQKGLALNGIDPEWGYLSPKSLKSIIYDDNPDKYDLHKLDLDEKDFDFVMVNQTLEHLYDPIRCLENIYKHMSPGGMLYLNVPANSIPHSIPFHYYTGYTPTGIGAVVAAAGFKIVDIGYWGNLEYLEKMNETCSWPDYRALKNPGLNDAHYPIITWVFAVK